MNEEQVLAVLGSVIDPEIGRSLAEVKMLAGVSVNDDGAIDVEVRLPTPAYPGRERIVERIQAAVAQKLPDAGSVAVKFSHCVRGKESGGKIGLKIKNIIAVGSGKGGVGKSTIASALAYGLKHFGAKVGLMDADVYGPSIPHLVGASGNPTVEVTQAADGSTVQRLQPIEHDGMKLLSIGFLIKEDQPVIWRGPMLHSLLTQFLQDSDWGELDYLVIDLPPGTGDIALTLSQLVELAGAVVVCTPQKIALLDAVKAIAMFRQVNIPVLGIVENMSGDVFGRGGARTKAAELGVPFLGEVPSLPAIREEGDEGRIGSVLQDGSPAREHLISVCERTAVEIAKQVLGSTELPSLDVL